MEIYRKRLIAYSLGNFSGFHNFTLEGVLGETVVLHVTVAADGSFRAGRLASVSLVEEGQPVPDPEGRGAALVADALPGGLRLTTRSGSAPTAGSRRREAAAAAAAAAGQRLRGDRRRLGSDLPRRARSLVGG